MLSSPPFISFLVQANAWANADFRSVTAAFVDLAIPNNVDGRCVRTNFIQPHLLHTIAKVQQPDKLSALARRDALSSYHVACELLVGVKTT